MSGSRHNKCNLSSYKQLISAIEQQYRDDPKKGYSGPIPIISYDTNCINARQRMLAMNELERLRDEGWVDLRKSNVLQARGMYAVADLYLTKTERPHSPLS